jgi:CRP-like cAMP-binding protein
MEALATPLLRRRGEVICEAERSAGCLYRVEVGAARRCALSADGRRRIVDLLFPGDFFGFAGESRAGSTVEALTEGTIVLRYPRRGIEALADSDPDAARVIRAIAFAAIARLETQIALLGRVNAVEKVGAFLLALEERQSAGGRRHCEERSDDAIQTRDGSIGEPPRDSGLLRFARNDGPARDDERTRDDGPSRVTLPVSRCDIGDFLALAPETVSRSLAALQRRGAISLPAPRHVEIRDRAALRARRPNAAR